MSNKKRPSSIHINKRGLFIDGDPINAPPRTVALLACLHPNLGRVVPYRQLLNALGYNPARRGAQKHLLRQYMLLIKTMLSAHKVPSFSLWPTMSGTGFASLPTTGLVLVLEPQAACALFGNRRPDERAASAMEHAIERVPDPLPPRACVCFETRMLTNT